MSQSAKGNRAAPQGKKKRHAQLVREILLAVQDRFPKAKIWAVNTGQYLARTKGGGLRPVKVNLTGIADVDGWIPLCGVAVRLGIEAKVPPDTQRPSQKVYGEQLNADGGIYVVAHSSEEAVSLVEDAAALIPVRVMGPGWESRYART